MASIAIVSSAVVSCSGYSAIPLGAAPSAKPNPTGVLQAGFSRVDITPPPGAGLMGLGTEGLAATGHRQRLFARAMYLEDKSGERIAIVSLDLGESSIVLHRRVALRLDSLGIHIGAERLLLSATHTHSGPSHFFGMPAFDELGSKVSGYDAVLTDTLVARITRAIVAAYESRTKARTAWGLIPIWHLTRIRSFPGFRENNASVRASLLSRFSPDASLPPNEAGVDPTFGMLRVDVWNSKLGKYEPRGAFSIFAIHGTAIPSGQRLYDSDLQGRIATLMEQHMSPDDPPYAPHAVHLLVNGGEGDVSPNVEPATRCPTPRLVRNGVEAGPRGMNFETDWKIIPRDKARDAACIPLALSEMERIAMGIVAQANSLYDHLGTRLVDDLPIRAAFTVLRADGSPSSGPRLCKPTDGVGTLLGAEDGWTRLRWDWEFLFSDSTTYPPNPSTRRTGGPSGCQGTKRNFLGKFQFLAAGPHGLPDNVQLSLVRLGSIALTFIPGEPTSNAAWTIRRATATALFGERSSADSVLMVSLTNGYIQYLTTPEEYRLQFYEGSATIYGPQELEVLTNAFRTMAAGLEVKPQIATITDSHIINAWSKGNHSIVRWDEKPNPSTDARPWRDLVANSSNTSVSLSWTGPAPASFYNSSDGPAIFFERRFQGEWRAVAWDNMPTVEVQVDRRGHGFARYTATWKTDSRKITNLRAKLAFRGKQLCHDMAAGVDNDC